MRTAKKMKLIEKLAKKLLLVSLIFMTIILASCHEKQTHIIIREINSKSYMVNNVELTSDESLNFLKNNKLPKRISYIAVDKRVDSKQKEIINFLIEQAKKDNVNINWDLPQSAVIDNYIMNNKTHHVDGKDKNL